MDIWGNMKELLEDLFKIIELDEETENYLKERINDEKKKL